MIGTRKQSSSPWSNKWVLRGTSLALLLTGWELLARARGGLLLPTASGTFKALIQITWSGELVQAFVDSNKAMVLGFIAATLIGVALGLLMGRIRAIEKIADVYLNLLLVVPMASLTPLILMVFGLGLLTRVIVVFLFAVVIITVNTRAGMRSIDPDLIEMARSFGAKEREIWRRIFLPGSLPAIIAGVRMGLGQGITGMVVVELLLIAVGLGRMILNSTGSFEAERTFAVIFVILIEAAILMNLTQGMERKLLPWRA